MNRKGGKTRGDFIPPRFPLNSKSLERTPDMKLAETLSVTLAVVAKSSVIARANWVKLLSQSVRHGHCVGWKRGGKVVSFESPSLAVRLLSSAVGCSGFEYGQPFLV